MGHSAEEEALDQYLDDLGAEGEHYMYSGEVCRFVLVSGDY